ncbi:hypothetical protein E4U53_008135 [Claviceps sorghi]|nr:hypothetical protein E4U53_008135 [Claviceps sorghi]
MQLTVGSSGSAVAAVYLAQRGIWRGLDVLISGKSITGQCKFFEARPVSPSNRTSSDTDMVTDELCTTAVLAEALVMRD